MTRTTAEKYKVTIRYMNGHVQTYTGSLAYCRRVRAPSVPNVSRMVRYRARRGDAMMQLL